MDVKEVSGHGGGPVHGRAKWMAGRSDADGSLFTVSGSPQRRGAREILAALGWSRGAGGKAFTPCTSTGEVVCSVL